MLDAHSTGAAVAQIFTEDSRSVILGKAAFALKTARCCPHGSCRYVRLFHSLGRLTGNLRCGNVTVCSLEPPRDVLAFLAFREKRCPWWILRPLITAASLPTNFRISEVQPLTRATGAPPPVPPLGPLAAFTGNWSGTGLNTIFRPDSSNTPTGTSDTGDR